MQTRRQEILAILKRNGEATVDELASMLELTPVTVRHHLDILRADGLVQSPAVRRHDGPGRPQYVYTLTDASAVHFPQRYDQLMVELLDELKATVGPRDAQELLYRIIEHRLENMPRVDLAWPLEQRLEHLTEYLTRQGHISSWERRDGRWYLYSSNCPYLHVAAEHPELCAMDTFLIRRLIGAQVVNLQHITDGSHMCIYRIDG